MSSPERHSSRPETRVFLENLPKDVRKDEIDKEFSIYGSIAKVYLIYDPPGSGFVEYFDAGDAEFAASSMNGVEFLGSKLKTQLTRGGVPRGRGLSRGGYSTRGRGYSSYGERDGSSYSGGFRRGGGGFRGSSRGGFESRGRSRGSGGSYGSSGGYGSTRGSFSKGFSGGGFSRGGGRGYSKGGEGSGGGYSSRFGGEGYRGNRYEEDEGQNGYEKYENYPKYDRYGGKGYDRHASSSSYSKIPTSYGSRKEAYPRNRSPLDASPEGYRSSSPYQRNRSRSPFGRAVRNSFAPRSNGGNQKSSLSDDREPYRRPRQKSSSNYEYDRGESSIHAYAGKQDPSSSYGSRRSTVEERF